MMCVKMRDMVISKLGGEMKRGVFSSCLVCASIPREDTELFLFPTLVTRRKSISLQDMFLHGVLRFSA